MKTKILSLLVLGVMVVAFSAPVLATAAEVEIPNPLKVNSISALIDRIVTYIIEIATILLPLAIIYSAYLFMSAGGDTEKITMGRKTLLWTVIGYGLILVSKGVTMIVAEILGGKS
ncbi:MAG: hypothetical protein ACYC3G_00280 [Minisyncoccota bacterium]